MNKSNISSQENCFWHSSFIESYYDVVIIGGGFVGMHTALILKKKDPKAQIMIIEKMPIGAAASSRNAGFACFGSVTELLADISIYGIEKVAELVEWRYQGLQFIQAKYGSMINYEQTGGYELFDSQETFDNASGHLKDINELVAPIIKENLYYQSRIPPAISGYKYCIKNDIEGHLDTGRYFHHLRTELIKADIRLLNGVTVNEIYNREKELKLDLLDRNIKAKEIVICTNSFNAQWVGDNTDIRPVRNQVLVTKPIVQLNVKGSFHMDRGYVYFRDIGDRLLIGGARNKFAEEDTAEIGLNEDNQNYLLALLRDKLPTYGDQIEIAHSWSGILSGGNNRLPIVKRTEEDIVLALRLGGMGVAISPIIAQQVAALIE